MSYARGLAQAAISEGARIFAHSHATKITPRGAGWQIDTVSGSINAEYVLIATNGYTDGLWPELQQAMVPVTSFIMATEPLSPQQLKTVLPGRHAVAEAHRIIVYYRLDAAGRFVIGGHGNWFNIRETGDCSHVKKEALALFPELQGIKWEFEWAGWPAMTMDRYPKIMKLADKVYSGFGYNGRGVGSATLMGRQLANLITDFAEPLIEIEPLKPIAGHRFRQMGISYHLLTGALLDRLERINKP